VGEQRLSGSPVTSYAGARALHAHKYDGRTSAYVTTSGDASSGVNMGHLRVGKARLFPPREESTEASDFPSKMVMEMVFSGCTLILDAGQFQCSQGSRHKGRRPLCTWFVLLRVPQIEIDVATPISDVYADCALPPIRTPSPSQTSRFRRGRSAVAEVTAVDDFSLTGPHGLHSGGDTSVSARRSASPSGYQDTSSRLH
jgi:hypothetical protein